MGLSREVIIAEIRGAKKGVKQCEAKIRNILEGAELKAWKRTKDVGEFILKQFEDALIYVDKGQK